VAEVAVYGVPHPYRIEAVAAAVVVKPGVEVTVAALRDRARERLAGFKVPEHIVLVDESRRGPRSPGTTVRRRSGTSRHSAGRRLVPGRGSAPTSDGFR
jgi:acyl-CoA synthetase (AMP-forming)/AMP-acid ligase II